LRRKALQALNHASEIVLQNVDRTDTQTVVNDFLSNHMLQNTLHYCSGQIAWATAKQAYIARIGPHVEQNLERLEAIKQDCFMVFCELLQQVLSRIVELS
jgi:hypothetical protein